MLCQFVSRPTFGFAFLVSCMTGIKENRPVSLSNSSASVTTSVYLIGGKDSGGIKTGYLTAG